ncbi:MAG: hypothetical protein HYZ75_19510 [Elusimicrobia bacterium]|nr:hypothetical protein [Elusimicrobiota bacterium]
MTAALLIALLAAAPAAAVFGSADGVLALEELPGWTVDHNANGAVLTLRLGAKTLMLRPAPDDVPLETMAAAQAAYERDNGRVPGPVELRASSGGFPFFLLQSRGPKGGRVLGALAVDRVRYEIEARGLSRLDAAVVVTALYRHDDLRQTARAPAEPEPSLPEAVLFGGLLRLPKPAEAHLSAQTDGWVVASGPGWSLGVFDGGPKAPLGKPEELLAAEIERRSRLLAGRGCKGSDTLDHPLKNGLTVLTRTFICPDAGPGVLAFIGGALRRQLPPIYLAGEYRTLAEFDAMLDWLASAKDRAEPSADPGPEAAPKLAWWGLLAGAAGLAALAVSASRGARTPR